jgi:replication fork protection complex subunit Csm3/Swi3
LSVWRDEAHGKTHDIDADLSLDSDVDEEGLNAKIAIGVSRPSVRTTSGGLLATNSLTLADQNTDRNDSSLPPSSRASSQPPTSDYVDDDLFGPSAPSRHTPNDAPTASPSVNVNKRIVLESDDDEEESFWKDLETARTLQPTRTNQQQSKSQPAHVQSLDNLDDAEMWGALEEGISLSSAVSGQPASGDSRARSDKVGEMDIDDDDMWEIIRENEKVTPAPQPPASETGALGAELATDAIKHPSISAGNQSLADSEMDWHDMYAD